MLRKLQQYTVSILCLVMLPLMVAEAARTLTLRAKVYEKLEQAGQLIEANQHTQAKALIDEVQKIANLNNFEKAQIANFLGFYYYDLKKYSQAIKSYQSVVANPKGLPDGLYNQTLYTLAQLYFEQEDYKKALQYAQEWFFATDEPSADAYMLIGQAYYMLKKYDKALPNVKKGIAMYEKAGRKPKENWLLLLRGIYYERNDYKNMLPAVKSLVKYYPKQQYMMTLAGIYNELNQESNMLAIFEAMYDSGYLEGKQKQLENLASLYLLQDIPIKAANLLEKEMATGTIKRTEKNLLLLAQSLATAKEYAKAISPLQEVAKQSGKGEHYMSLAQSLLALGEWGQAEQALLTALNKDDLKRKDKTWINLGLARLEQKKFTSAKKAFQQAQQDKRSADLANRWIRYADAEIKRLEALKAPVIIDAGPLLSSNT